MRRTIVTLVALAALVLGTCVSASAQAGDPVSLANDLTAAFNARNAGAMLDLFTLEGTVTFAVQGTATEVISARDWASRLESATSTEIPPDLRMSVVGSPVVAGDRLTWTWRQTASFIREFGVEYLDYTVEATMAEGKFSTIIISPTAETLAAVPFGGGVTGGVGMPRTGTASLIPGLMLIAFLAVLFTFAGMRLRSLAIRR